MRVLLGIISIITTFFLVGAVDAQQETIEIRIVRESSTLIIYVPPSVPVDVISELGFRIGRANPIYRIIDYPQFRELDFSIVQTPACFVLRVNVAAPLTIECGAVSENSLFLQNILAANAFWFDQSSNQALPITVLRNDTPIVQCPGHLANCRVSITLDSPSPLPIDENEDPMPTLDPRAEINFQRGRVFFEEGEYRQAVDAFTISLQFNPSNNSAYLYRAYSYAALGEDELAISDSSYIIQLNPDSPLAYHNRGIIYIAIGRNEEALLDFRRAVEIDTTFTIGYEYLGETLDRLGYKAEALDAYQHYIALAGSDASQTVMDRIITLQAELNTVQPTYTATSIPNTMRTVMYVSLQNPETDRARVRSASNLSSQVIATLVHGDRVVAVAVVSGESIGNNNIWYEIQLPNNSVGYIHNSLLSLQVVPARMPSPSVTVTTGAFPTTPAPTGTCQTGSFTGAASDLFLLSGRRRQTLNVNAGTQIIITLTVSQDTGDWGVGVVLLSPMGIELDSRQLFDENGFRSVSFAYVAAQAGAYALELRGDSTHRYSYRVEWLC